MPTTNTQMTVTIAEVLHENWTAESDSDIRNIGNKKRNICDRRRTDS